MPAVEHFGWLNQAIRPHGKPLAIHTDINLETVAPLSPLLFPLLPPHPPQTLVTRWEPHLVMTMCCFAARELVLLARVLCDSHP